MDIVVENGHHGRSSNLGRVCISHCTNTLGKIMNSTVLPQAMNKIAG